MNTEKALGAVRYASRTTGVDFEKILTWAAIGGVAFVALKIWNTASAAKQALTEVGSKIGTGLYDWIHGENAGVGEMTFYAVRFPDGNFHAVPAGKVNPLTGEFVNKDLAPSYPGDGKKYRIARSPTALTHPKTGKPFSHLFAVAV